ncbi:MAG: hypothetical protein KAS71_19255 [Bacteroidales bacterium]|nr:hypothetical protein [Bacteroidales bacterium]
MKRILLTILTTIILVSMLHAQNSQPNVLFIAVDDLNDFPSFCQHYPDAITPNMDKLAKHIPPEKKEELHHLMLEFMASENVEMKQIMTKNKE